jgi:N-acetylmuramoyl-L-alanine amidase
LPFSGSASVRRLALISLCAAIVLPASAERAVVRVSVDTSGPTTRLVLTHAAPVTYEVLTVDDGLEIVFAERIKLDPSSKRLGDAILARYDLDDDRRLKLFTGPGYRSYESFELLNPFRLVLDLQGSRSSDDDATAQAPPTRDPRRRVVVIDPGHGGVETGATGPSGLQEKDVTLDLARRLRSELDRGSTDVVLTRDEDRLVGLDERSAIANHNRADLFLSIHLNASVRRNANGAETYYLAKSATDDEARTLAAQENDAAGGRAGAGGSGASTALDLVLWDLAQNQYLAESSQLAESIQRRLNEVAGTRDRGVRQAPFRVLMGATMPAILVEVGFITSPDEEQRLHSGDYREQIVRALAAAINEYLARVDRLTGLGTP